ncbi:MAG: CapA family protein [Clostridiales bacterium]|nr:CapA family protein [Clostridiales bacterium]
MSEKKLAAKPRTVALACLVAAFIMQGCQWAAAPATDANQKELEIEIDMQEEAPAEPVQLVIACVGDVMVHKSQIASQYDSAMDAYDYNNNFAYVKKHIESADLAICNLETTFGGKPYTGYPVFSAPDELASALRSAGFDVAVTANNHMLDRGVAGLKRTIEVLRANGLPAAGSREEPEQANYVIADVKGVKVGVVAYTYASSSQSGDLLVNGSAVSRDAAALINFFRYSQIDEDLEKIKRTVADAREAGADVVAVYYHWGEEFHLQPSAVQRYIAEKTVNDMDVDMIFASHPHTLQEAGYVRNDRTGALVPVFYSIGNFISNQRVETLDVMNSKYTEIGVIAKVAIEYDVGGNRITRMETEAVPTWVEKYKSGGRDVYAVIPLDEDLAANECLAASGHLGRAQKAREDAYGILGIN